MSIALVRLDLHLSVPSSEPMCRVLAFPCHPIAACTRIHHVHYVDILYVHWLALGVLLLLLSTVATAEYFASSSPALGAGLRLTPTLSLLGIRDQFSLLLQ